jgi:hypothetical protein
MRLSKMPCQRWPQAIESLIYLQPGSNKGGTMLTQNFALYLIQYLTLMLTQINARPVKII